MHPAFHQEIARSRQADLLKEAGLPPRSAGQGGEPAAEPLREARRPPAAAPPAPPGFRFRQIDPTEARRNAGLRAGVSSCRGGELAGARDPLVALHRGEICGDELGGGACRAGCERSRREHVGADVRCAELGRVGGEERDVVRRFGDAERDVGRVVERGAEVERLPDGRARGAPPRSGACSRPRVSGLAGGAPAPGRAPRATPASPPIPARPSRVAPQLCRRRLLRRRRRLRRRPAPLPLARLEPVTQGFDERRIGLVALRLQGRLEIGHRAAAELAVLLDANDDLVEDAPEPRKLLRRAHPGFGCRWKCRKGLGDLSVRRSSSCHRFTRRVEPRFSSLECVLQFREAARDAAGDRPGREVRGRRRSSCSSRRARRSGRGSRGSRRRAAPAPGARRAPRRAARARRRAPAARAPRRPASRARCAELVDAEPPGQLREPGTDRAVVAEPVEMLVGACEDLLEDVLGVGSREPEALGADRVDVAREALDQGPATHRRRPRGNGRRGGRR